MTELEQFYENQPPHLREVYLALKQIIMAQDPLITAEWKYKLPFFIIKEKCYVISGFIKNIKNPIFL